ncbi:hypothetical protein [Pseudofrankia asymbiotica]|uniref:Uncharacterized protein n=1 Tax=Pseudofrankia asymbiotica TaxID=1834516 RepID=A0A1V2IA36_9ACTN|nr:hypothetical protein [Pseudofrankia asymbiotica]ONH29775.1 hypothetical protein BL253_16160 [Pseudofrankia asymbiotica]
MTSCLWKHAEGHDPVPAAHASRPYHVYDHEGEHLGSFTAWETAHEWAHLQVALSALPAPLEVEDRHRDSRRQVWADYCAPFPAPAETADTTGDNDNDGQAATAFAFTPPHPRRPS